MEKEWNVNDVMRHSRHDWLNKIQLIKGNLDLNKLDRAKAIIEEIIIESQSEAMLSSLNMPQFSELMLTGNWNGYSFKIEYEVIGSEGVYPELDKPLTLWTKDLFSEIESSIEPFMESTLIITIFKEGKNIRFLYELQGNITSEEKIMSFILKKQQGFQINLLRMISGELSIEITADS
ncbi:stage 0 sporulation protein B (sporulation initiation phosphotransferase) [Peribacillus deserti]|uniref:Stage 0 sporulation protein B (Sporulation initiation phosphotransferase) n=1 Tax=Peribacillus deserti TaxID=673318 RepID=A0ABS2QFI6_9BACI|nr:Spo0B domain-containing protein [Peribacillus deserti]MBM7691911.1 stage 0 sporulation protein B (sporulation initiation phosphotransferase) [Peribacillus deserti]